MSPLLGSARKIRQLVCLPQPASFERQPSLIETLRYTGLFGLL